MKKAFFLFLLAFLLPFKAEAELSRFAESQLCTRYFSEYEKLYQIPENMLQAIAQVESGVWDNASKSTLPWPWTANYGGTGKFFSSRQELLEWLQEMDLRSIKSIDVGCMQVNLYYHSHAFSSREQAVDPRQNVEYAARFLREKYDETKNWFEAVGAYHSKTYGVGSEYASKVMARWRNPSPTVASPLAVLASYNPPPLNPPSAFKQARYRVPMITYEKYIPKSQWSRASSLINVRSMVKRNDLNGYSIYQRFNSNRSKVIEIKKQQVASYAPPGDAVSVKSPPSSTGAVPKIIKVLPRSSSAREID